MELAFSHALEQLCYQKPNWASVLDSAPDVPVKFDKNSHNRRGPGLLCRDKTMTPSTPNPWVALSGTRAISIIKYRINHGPVLVGLRNHLYAQPAPLPGCMPMAQLPGNSEPSAARHDLEDALCSFPDQSSPAAPVRFVFLYARTGAECSTDEGALHASGTTGRYRGLSNS